MYGVEPFFWLKLILLLAIMLILIFSFNKIMRNWFKVEKKKFFSYNHVNEKHKKVDWTIRIITFFTMLLGLVITISREPIEIIWFIQPWFILFVFIGVSQMVRAIMERKYAKNPNDYKLTISELVFMLILIFILFVTDFFGLFSLTIK